MKQLVLDFGDDNNTISVTLNIKTIHNEIIYSSVKIQIKTAEMQ